MYYYSPRYNLLLKIAIIFYSEDFSTSHAINVAGPYFTTIAFAPLLTKSNNASVIIIASIAPFAQQKTVGAITYPVSKGGGKLISV